MNKNMLGVLDFPLNDQNRKTLRDIYRPSLLEPDNTGVRKL